MIAPLVGGLWFGQQQWEIEELLVAGTTWQLAAGVNTRIAVSFYVPKAGILDGFEVHTGAVTAAQDLKCSFQDVDTSDNPDGVVDQFVVVASASVVADSWVATGPITSDGTPGGTPRTVTFGQRISAVIEWNAVVGNARFYVMGQSSQVWFASNVQGFLASWSRFTAFTPVVVLRYTDGSTKSRWGAGPCWVPPAPDRPSPRRLPRMKSGCCSRCRGTAPSRASPGPGRWSPPRPTTTWSSTTPAASWWPRPRRMRVGPT